MTSSRLARLLRAKYGTDAVTRACDAELFYAARLNAATDLDAQVSAGAKFLRWRWAGEKLRREA